MDNLTIWWNALSGLEQFFWAIAIPFTAFFSIQFLLTLLGFDHDHEIGDLDTDMDLSDGDSSITDAGDAFQLFSIRSIISFFTMFGWAGIAFLRAGWTPVGTFIMAFILGTGMMFLVSYLFHWMLKMQQSGTMQIHNALFETGEVYIPIPAAGKGRGKVQIAVQGTLRELEAITEGKHRIPTGTKVKVKEIMADDVLLVTPLEMLVEMEQGY